MPCSLCLNHNAGKIPPSPEHRGYVFPFAQQSEQPWVIAVVPHLYGPKELTSDLLCKISGSVNPLRRAARERPIYRPEAITVRKTTGSPLDGLGRI